MFNQSTNPNLKKKRAGMFGAAFDQYANEAVPSPDPTPDEAAVKYAPKPEFNADWTQRREREQRPPLFAIPDAAPGPVSLPEDAANQRTQTAVIMQRPLEPLPDKPLFEIPPVQTEQSSTTQQAVAQRDRLVREVPPAPADGLDLTDANLQMRPRIVPENQQPAPPVANVSKLSPVEEQRARFQDAVLAPVQKQGLGKQILFQVLQGLGNVTGAMQGREMQPVKFLGQAIHDAGVNREAMKLAPLQAQEDRQRQAALEQARIDDIPFERQQRQDALDERRRSSALRQLNGLKWFDPNNRAHAALAEDAGLKASELQGWDDRDQNDKKVAGLTYRLNRVNGKYEQTDLPAEDSATLTDYLVRTPTGEIRTYRVAQKDAARFSEQMQALGIPIKAANEEKTDQQNFQTRMTNLQNNLSARLIDYKAKVEAAKNEADLNRRLQLQVQAQKAYRELAAAREEFDRQMILAGK